MDTDFFAYLQQLELMAFFSGYPLIYAFTLYLFGNQKTENSFKSRVVSLLPFAYALVGTLYLGLQLKKLYPDYSIENIELSIAQPWLIAWGLLSILFWIPAFSKKIVFSLIHSLSIFLFLLIHIFIQLFATVADKNLLNNDMKIYSGSLLLNMAALTFIACISFLFTRYKKR
jgi:hypothetical protein